ncbi:hypothetical protein J3R82DRAFT_10104 [Butyriboletus roseoflavus]|nr:hypothetical protein J3R82DRAFT_10104 [Butyriboletus roseoflavus]
MKGRCSPSTQPSTSRKPQFKPIHVPSTSMHFLPWDGRAIRRIRSHILDAERIDHHARAIDDISSIGLHPGITVRHGRRARLNVLTPQFKRLTAFQGDAILQAPQRFFLQNQSGKQNIWTSSMGHRSQGGLTFSLYFFFLWEVSK